MSKFQIHGSRSKLLPKTFSPTGGMNLRMWKSFFLLSSSRRWRVITNCISSFLGSHARGKSTRRVEKGWMSEPRMSSSSRFTQSEFRKETDQHLWSNIADFAQNSLLKSLCHLRLELATFERRSQNKQRVSPKPSKQRYPFESTRFLSCSKQRSANRLFASLLSSTIFPNVILRNRAKSNFLKSR